MSEPLFLNLEDTYDLHTESLGSFGGSDGIRDQAGLESAVAHPETEYWRQMALILTASRECFTRR